MEVSIEKVSNGYIVKKFAVDEFKEEDVVLVALNFEDVISIIRDYFVVGVDWKTTDKVNEVNYWDIRVPDETDTRDWEVKVSVPGM